MPDTLPELLFIGGLAMFVFSLFRGNFKFGETSLPALDVKGRWALRLMGLVLMFVGGYMYIMEQPIPIPPHPTPQPSPPTPQSCSPGSLNETIVVIRYLASKSVEAGKMEEILEKAGAQVSLKEFADQEHDMVYHSPEMSPQIANKVAICISKIRRMKVRANKLVGTDADAFVYLFLP